MMQKLLINKSVTEIEELEKLFLDGLEISNLAIRENLNNLLLSETDTRKSSFLEYILFKHRINNILIGDINELNLIIEEIQNSYSDIAFWEIGPGGIMSTTFGSQIIKAFNYSGLRKSDYFKEFYLNILPKTCSYCNQHELQGLVLENGIKLLCDFDHFYPKVYFPYLSTSFYNLIPACNYCNSRTKGREYYKSTDIIHPYSDSYNSLCSFKLDRIISVPVDNGFKIEIENPDNSSKIENHNNEFLIINRYEDYRELVIALVQESLRLTDEEIENNVSIFKLSIPTFSREKYIDNVIRATLDSNRILDYPKGKFIRDIALRLGIHY